LKKESAFVIQLSEAAANNGLEGAINQLITERFGVLVALDNGSSDRDKVGLIAYDTLAMVRSEIFKAILGWQMTGAESVVSYGGGKIAGINRAYLWYQFEFIVTTRITDDDGIDVGTAELGPFDTIYAQWILSPSAKLDALGENLPITVVDVDMTTVIDFTSNPDVEGPFGRGFGIKFDTFKP